eukprot:SAG11_NODE_34896_length_269_cov_1.170588_1_plen_45_part_10
MGRLENVHTGIGNEDTKFRCTTWASNSSGKRDSKVLRTDLEKRLW